MPTEPTNHEREAAARQARLILLGGPHLSPMDRLLVADARRDAVLKDEATRDKLYPDEDEKHERERIVCRIKR